MKKALAFTALALVLLFVTGFQTTSQLASQLTTIQFQLVNLKTQISGLEAQVASLEAKTKGPREFYLTTTTHTGSNALSACAPGYHMASLYEIRDPSNLRYNTELGFTAPDAGSGPPASHGGWVRTGVVLTASNIPGVGNCNVWTSVSGFGSIATLDLGWINSAEIASPWKGATLSCSIGTAVWCVQD